MGGGHLLEVKNKAVEKTEDEGGTGTAEGDEGEVSVLYIEHHHAPLLVLTPNPANILAKLSVYQPLLLARRRHFTQRDHWTTSWTTASMFDRYIELREEGGRLCLE